MKLAIKSQYLKVSGYNDLSDMFDVKLAFSTFCVQNEKNPKMLFKFCEHCQGLIFYYMLYYFQQHHNCELQQFKYLDVYNTYC